MQRDDDSDREEPSKLRPTEGAHGEQETRTNENRGDRVTLCDLGSKHGSYLNDSFLEPNEEYALKSGDEICLGRLKLRYTAEQNNE